MKFYMEAIQRELTNLNRTTRDFRTNLVEVRQRTHNSSRAKIRIQVEEVDSCDVLEERPVNQREDKKNNFYTHCF